MKEKPIIFSTPMVKALLNTRPGVWPPEPIDPSKPFKSQTRRVVPETKAEFIHVYADGKTTVKPKYNAGDILWVREMWNYYPDWKCKVGQKRPDFLYKASATQEEESWLDKWKPSIHMPREAARIFLEVKSVRVERLWKICERDARAEGVCPIPPNKYGQLSGTEHFYAFFRLWNSINAKRGYSWESNPWVWVYEFLRIK